MNSDATEAALGLLGLSPFNAPSSHPQPQPRLHHHVAHAHGPSLTSPSVGIAVDRTSTPHVVQAPLPSSLVPLKRKQPSPATAPSPPLPGTSKDAPSTKPRQPSHPLATSSTPPIVSNHPLPNKSSPAPSQRLPPQRPFSPAPVPPHTSPTSQHPLASPSTSQHPLALSDGPPPPDSDAISCICGYTYDDGFSIACDDCSRWCHAACFGIVQGGEVPEFWKCWVCDPTVEVDKERAVKTQKGRLKAMRMKASHGTSGAAAASNGTSGNSAVDDPNSSGAKPSSKRKTSPGAERKSRRGSAVAAAIEGSGSSRKKKRAAMLSPVDPLSPSIPLSNHPTTQPPAGGSRISHPNGNCSATPPDPVTFPPDVYSSPSIHAHLLRVAKAWRGVTALNPPSPLIHPPPKTYNDRGYTRVDSQGYRDRYGYSMSPLDNTTPVIMDENAGDVYVPRTVLRTDPPISCPPLPSGSHPHCPSAPSTCSPTHLRPPSPRFHVSSDPSPFPHTSIYPSPPISNYMSPSVPSSSNSRAYAKSPLTPSTNTISSPNQGNTIPATTLLAPYTAAIIPSAAYLADPLNGYAHLGMAKPQVKLVGGGWEVGLDARGIGDVPDPSDSVDKKNGASMNKDDNEEGKAKWARCGCWPNAVVRPIICGGTKRGDGQKGKRPRHRAECAKATTVSDGGISSPTVNGRSIPPPISRMQERQTDESSDQDDIHSVSDSDVDSTTLSFALFALRDLRADEEIVLGWEWDDGHAVHMLPALMESPGLFAPAHLHHLRAQFTSILHALSSTFTTCACGSSTRDCAVRVMERVVEGRWPWPGAETVSEGSEGDSSDMDGTSEDCNNCGEIDVEGDGPHSGRNWGLGVNMGVDMDRGQSIEVNGQTRRVKKRKVRKKDKAGDATLPDGSKERGAAESCSGLMPKPKVNKAVDLGPLVGVKRGFRTREKEPTNGGWGGVEIVPSSLKPFPDVGSHEDVRVEGRGKAKAWVADDDDNMDVDPPPSTLPPRMRKAWSQPSKGQWQQDDPLQDHSRSVQGEGTESPMSVCGDAEGSSSKEDDPKQCSASVNGDGDEGADGQETEFDTETEADGLDDTRQMPPPPMPASLDPTTVSSLDHAQAMSSSSPHGSVQREKNNVPLAWIPPRTMTPASVSSEKPSQLPDQNPCTVDSTSPFPSIARSPTPSQVNHLTSSPSFPSTTQAKIESHLPAPSQSHPPPPSVSPSAPFSKLSLGSPDTPASPHITTLLALSDSVPVSAPEQSISNHRPPSPQVYRPSKPLHVHPQNEPPSLAVSLAVPLVTSRPTDGTRDTPAEAQYQHAYRASPEVHEICVSDPAKKRPINGDAHRVRFASPEILCSSAPLSGKMASSDSKPLSSAGGVLDNADASEVVLPLEGDLMVVDIQVVGDKDQEDSKGPSHAASPVNRTDSDEHTSRIPGSPCLEAPSDPLPCTSPTAMDGLAPEDVSSPLASDANEASHSEPMNVDSESAEPTREPSPPPPPKVKMSLKDFALRKKKQREEEMAAKALRSPATPEGLGIPSSPDVKDDLQGEQHTGIVQPDSVVSMTTKGEVVANSPETLHTRANGFNVHADGPGFTENIKAEEDNLPAEIQTSTIVVMKGVDIVTVPPSAQPQSPCLQTLPRVLSGKHCADQTQTQTDSKSPATATLKAKVEVVDVEVPSGLVGVDDRMPDVVSFAPEPPPPPLTIKKQTSNNVPVDQAASGDRNPRLVPPSTPAYSSTLSTPASTTTSASTSAVNSRSNSVGLSASTPNPSAAPQVLTPTTSLSNVAARRPSHEDGEITSSTPPKGYLPRSHTPPTQPRSFHTAHPQSPSFGPTSSSSSAPPAARRPAPPLSRSSLSNTAGPTPPPISSRPLPSGPRALRGSMTSSTHSSQYASGRPPYTGSQYIPRGPSADRDRVEWERSDRQWPAPVRSRGRAGSNGWGR